MTGGDAQRSFISPSDRKRATRVTSITVRFCASPGTTRRSLVAHFWLEEGIPPVFQTSIQVLEMTNSPGQTIDGNRYEPITNLQLQ